MGGHKHQMQTLSMPLYKRSKRLRHTQKLFNKINNMDEKICIFNRSNKNRKTSALTGKRQNTKVPSLTKAYKRTFLHPYATTVSPNQNINSIP